MDEIFKNILVAHFATNSYNYTWTLNIEVYRYLNVLK